MINVLNHNIKKQKWEELNQKNKKARNQKFRAFCRPATPSVSR